MKLFKSIRNFFHVRYVQFVQMVTLYMLGRSEKLVKKMIHLKGRDFVDSITPWMLNHTNSLVRQAIVFQGKDPDYIPPPPPPPKPVEPSIYTGFDPMKAQATLTNFYSTKRPVWVGVAGNAGTDAWIRNPSLHPVLDARKQFAEKQAKLKAKMKAAPPVEDPEVLQVAASEALEGQDEEFKQVSEE